MIPTAIEKLWHKLNRTGKATSVFLLALVVVRSLPYLAPITADDLTQEQQAWEFVDRQGLPLGTLLTQNQEHTLVVTLTEISPHFQHAILAAEDADFYHHGALDVKAIARAIFQAVKHRRIFSGASTITMQLARMLEPAPRTLPAKLREIWLSWRLTAGMSKDEILHAYINRLPMGSNIYGVEAAARIYFGTSASELNVAQASLLAALPNNPNYLNPYSHEQALKRRQQYVLKRMVQEGYLSQEQLQRAWEEKIALQPRQQGIIAAPHFLFWLASQLPPEQSSPIYTTLDRPLQQFVETQLQQIVSQLSPDNVNHGAAIVLDNHTGEVLAYVGSPDYFAVNNLGRNDGVQALRQPGSTLKPFLYQLALEQGTITPHTILADVPTHYALTGGRIYRPTDYSETFMGPVRVRVALANSLNVPAVRVLEQVGVAAFLQRLQQLGFSHLKQPPEYYGLGLTLGSGEVTLWELAQAYLTLARQTAGENRKVEDMGVASQSSSIPALITDMLSDRYARAHAFGVESVLNLPFPAAVKTGTSSNFRDTWTVGYTTDYTVATWIGNFSGEPMNQVSGVRGAAPLWQRIVLYLHQDREPTPFPAPQLPKLPICATSGRKPTSDCPAIVQEYIYPEDLATYEENSDLVLPETYNYWLAKQAPLASMPSQLRILSPIEGEIFWFYPQSQQQKLEFKLAGVHEEPVEWWLNGKRLVTQASNSLFWQLSPGNWTLTVKKGSEIVSVNFQVQLAPTGGNRSGFSLVSIPPNSD